MAVSDGRFAAQLVVPGEDARFFDDVGCLANYLRSKHDLSKGARMYVTDHLTHAWIDAGSAVYTRVESLETPMGSHLLAHASAGLRGQDAEATGGQPLSAAEVFGASVAHGASR